MELIQLEYRDKMAIVRLDRGITNAINLKLVDQLRRILLKLRDDSTVQSIVLGSSSDKFYSIGFDIPELLELSRNEFKIFYHAFNQLCIDLYIMPKPTLAAITGHAIAGGCILALCCDYRFMADGRKLMGLNEIKLGVPVPYPGDSILRDLVGTNTAREIVGMGEFYQSYELLRMGMVDHVLPVEQVLPKSIERAKMLGTFPCKASVAIKRNRVEMIEQHIRRHLLEKEHIFTECWYSNEARKRLQEAIKKF